MSSGSVMSAMKPIPSDHGTVLGKDCAKARVRRELEYAHLPVLVGAEGLPKIGYRIFQALDYALNIPFVSRMVIDGKLDAIPVLDSRCVTRRQHRVKILHWCIHLVHETPAIALRRLSHKVTGCNRDLVGRR